MFALTQPSATLMLPAALRARVEATALAGHPLEVCGVLAGRREGPTVRVETVFAGRNVVTTRAHDRYELDPRDFLHADRAARASGREVVGFWHSHPGGRPEPSACDRESAWPDYVYLIVAVGPGGVTGTRGWSLVDDAFVELALV